MEIPAVISVIVLNLKAVYRQNSFLFWKPWSVVLRPSTDWMRAVHVMEGDLLYVKAADLDVNHIKKNTFTATSRLVFDQISVYDGLAKLTDRNESLWITCDLEVPLLGMYPKK